MNKISDTSIAPTNIHVERARWRLSQEVLAKRVGTSRQSIHAIETGKDRNPNVKLILRIAQFFGVSVEYLFPLSAEEGGN